MTEINLDDAYLYELLLPEKKHKKVTFDNNEIIIPKIIEKPKNKISIKYLIIIVVILLISFSIYFYYDIVLKQKIDSSFNIDNIMTYDTRIIIK